MYAIEKSTQLLAQSKQALAGGVASSLRAAQKPTPLFADRGQGAMIYDVDGHAYIDYLLAYGPLILGHAHPKLVADLHAAMQQGMTYGLQHRGEIELSERIKQLLPAAERVSLSGSGTEAVMLALRLSRAYTGRLKVVRFEGHFHGWSDSIFTAFPSSGMAAKVNDSQATAVPPGTEGQSENSLSDIILLPWNDPERLEAVLKERHQEIAAIITEPVMCNSGCILPKPGYLEKIRALTEQYGIVMIMDEVITGFRLSAGGAQGKFGIKPDLTIIGKALGGGIAISAVAGKYDVMKLIEEGTVNHLGTLNGNCVATAAAMSVIDTLTADNGAVYAQMEALMRELAAGLQEACDARNIAAHINIAGPVFHMMFIDQDEVTDFATFQSRDAASYSQFAALMLEEGVLIRPNGLWYISAVHDAAHIRATIEAAGRALDRLAAGN